jgi:hypothetical protein
MLSAFHTKLKEGSLKERKGGQGSCSIYYTPFLSSREEGTFCAVNNQLGKTQQIMKKQEGDNNY